MNYAAYPRPILGPCSCTGCREPLFWAKRNSRHEGQTFELLVWREWTGRIHKCPKATTHQLGLRKRHDYPKRVAA